jgi:uncharacterized protein YegL
MMGFAGARSAFKGGFSTKNSIPPPSTLTYEGLFSENFFQINTKETKLTNNLEISLATITNPITQKDEQFLGLLMKSKYDGIGIRKPINLSIAVDISGSMHGSRLTYAKEAIKKLIQNLLNEDYIGITSFDDSSYVIVPFTSKKELDITKTDAVIDSLSAIGGTNLFSGLKGAVSNLKTKINESSNQFNRIIFITDMEYFNDSNFMNLYKNLANENIFITVLGISKQFNTELQEQISQTKGSNYYIIEQMSDLEKYLNEEFNYICFPASFDIKLEFMSPGFVVRKVIGAGKTTITHKEEEKEKEWTTDGHKNEAQIFQKQIFALLAVFHKLNYPLPKPILSCICNFLRNKKKVVCEISTSFPSSLKTMNHDSLFVEGGMILLKIEKELNCPFANIKLCYKDIIDNYKDKQQQYLVHFKEEQNKQYFSNKNIKKAIGLYYYASFLRKIMKVYHRYNNEQTGHYLNMCGNTKETIDKQYFASSEFKEMKLRVNTFFKEMMKDVLDDKEKEKYLKQFDNITSENILSNNYPTIQIEM